MSRKLTATWKRNYWRVSLAAVVAAAESVVPAAANGQVTLLNTWGSLGSGDGQFGLATGVAVGPTGTVYVADSTNNRVEIFNSSGGFQSTFGSFGSGNGQFSGQFGSPLGVAVSSDGTVYVTDAGGNRVEGFDSLGDYQFDFGSSGGGSGQFVDPGGVAVGPNGVDVADLANYRVQAFNSSGGFQNAFGSFGSGNGQFDPPVGLAIGSVGNFSAGKVYVTDGNNERVEVFNASGTFLSTFGSFGSGNGQFNSIAGIAVGPTGTVYVADLESGRVEVFNSSGVFQSIFAASAPQGVAVAPTGLIYTTDNNNSRVERFFDPSSWVSGTNYFTDLTTGPTSVDVGPSQILGTALTVNSAMGLVVGNNLNVDSGGSLTQTGGTITTTNLNISGSFNYQGGGLYAANTSLNTGGSLSASAYTVGAGQSVNQLGGTLSVSNLTVAGNYTYSSGTVNAPSSIVVSPGGSFSAPGLTLNIGSAQSVSLSGGPISVFVFSVGGVLQATQGGQLIATGLDAGLGVLSGGEVVLDGGTSLSCGTVSLGGLLAMGNATLSVPTLAGNQPFRIFHGGEVQLENANTSILQTPQLLNEPGGLLDGAGRINGQLQNFSGARVSVATGQTMTISGAGNTNDGLMSLTGGVLRFAQDLTNASDGSVAGTGTLEADGGLANNGSITVGGLPTYLFGGITNNSTLALAGSSFVFGNVTNASSGTIHLSGATNVFYGTVASTGALKVDPGASGIFYGSYSGSGPITNSGSLFIHATSIAGPITGGGTLTLGDIPSLTITPSVNPVLYGQPVTLTATMGSVSGYGFPTGTITFSIGGFIGSGGASIGSAALSNGVATLTVPGSAIDPAIGAHVQQVFANYVSDGVFASTGASYVQTIRYGTTTTIASSPNPSQLGQQVTFTVTVAAPNITGLTPSGTVTLSDSDGSQLDGAVFALDASGVATIPFNQIPLGPDNIQATYSGDVSFLTSTSSVFSQNVQTTTTTTMTSSVSSGNITLFITVTPNTTGEGTPTGTVDITDPGYLSDEILPLDASGVASYSVTFLLALHPSITMQATYSGDPVFLPSTAVNYTISKEATTTTITSSANPAIAGEDLTLFVTVTPNTTGQQTPTGTVDLTAPGIIPDQILTLNASGVASYTIVGGLPSTITGHPQPDVDFQASYSGDAIYSTSASDPYVQITGVPGIVASSGSVYTLTSSAGGQSTLTVTAGSITLTSDLSSLLGNYILSIGGGATVILASSQTVGEIQLTGSGSLDVVNYSATISFGSAANDPLASITAALTRGYNDGNWTGAGIMSSAAAVSPSQFALGYLDGNILGDTLGGTVGPNQIIIKYTIPGNAYFEPTIGFKDLVIVAQHFGFTGEDWAGGNFNYDPSGSVGFADLVSIAQNFGFSSGADQGSVGGGLAPAWQTGSGPIAAAQPAAISPAVFAASVNTVSAHVANEALLGTYNVISTSPISLFSDTTLQDVLRSWQDGELPGYSPRNSRPD